MKRFALALLACLAPVSAFAAPIGYTELQNNVAVFDKISPLAGWNTPATARYFSFFVTGEQAVSITGTRVDYGYDMAFWLFSGLFDDTDQFGLSFDSSDAAFAAFYDDQIPAPGGLFADPQFVGTLSAGWYTVAVTNAASNGITGPDQMYDFRLVGGNIGGGIIPEPAPLALLGFGLVAIVLARRR